MAEVTRESPEFHAYLEGWKSAKEILVHLNDVWSGSYHLVDDFPMRTAQDHQKVEMMRHTLQHVSFALIGLNRAFQSGWKVWFSGPGDSS